MPQLDRRLGWPLGWWAGDGAWIQRHLDGTVADGWRTNLRVAADASHSDQPQADPRTARGTNPCADRGIRRTGTTKGRPRDRHAARSRKRIGPAPDCRLSQAQPVGDWATTVYRRPTGNPNLRISASEVTNLPCGSRQTCGKEDSLLMAVAAPSIGPDRGSADIPTIRVCRRRTIQGRRCHVRLVGLSHARVTWNQQRPHPRMAARSPVRVRGFPGSTAPAANLHALDPVRSQIDFRDPPRRALWSLRRVSARRPLTPVVDESRPIEGASRCVVGFA